MTETEPVKPSCATCPALIKASEGGDILTKSIGVDICGRFGFPLDRVGLSRRDKKDLQEIKAATCGHHGEPLPGIRGGKERRLPNPDLSVAFPIKIADEEDKGDDRVRSCTNCFFYVKSDVALQEFGFASPMCRARGTLLQATRLLANALTCKTSQLKVTDDPVKTDDIILRPEYLGAFTMANDPIARWRANKGKVIDPGAHPTDKPVTPEDVANGIRSWRKISATYATSEVFLPIYLRSYFSPEEQEKIPNTGDDEHPELYLDHNEAVYRVAVLWMELDETPMLWGQAGVGKTELYRHMAWLMQVPFERISITASTELDDLAGKTHFGVPPTREAEMAELRERLVNADGDEVESITKALQALDNGNETYFEYGRIPRAWQKPCVLCIDEPNVGPVDVWQFIRPLTDNSKQLVLDQNRGERISRHPDCYLGMAANPSWDTRNTGALEIGDADGSRLMHLYMELPPEALEREIIQGRCELDGWTMPSQMLSDLMATAKDIRAMCEDGTLAMTWGIRSQIKVARSMRWFPAILAFKLGSGDALEPAASQALLDAVKSHFAPEEE